MAETAVDHAQSFELAIRTVEKQADVARGHHPAWPRRRSPHQCALHLLQVDTHVVAQELRRGVIMKHLGIMLKEDLLWNGGSKHESNLAFSDAMLGAEVILATHSQRKGLSKVFSERAMYTSFRTPKSSCASL